MVSPFPLILTFRKYVPGEKAYPNLKFISVFPLAENLIFPCTSTTFKLTFLFLCVFEKVTVKKLLLGFGNTLTSLTTVTVDVFEIVGSVMVMLLLAIHPLLSLTPRV